VGHPFPFTEAQELNKILVNAASKMIKLIFFILLGFVLEAVFCTETKILIQVNMQPVNGIDIVKIF
jgi:hypothetical protein